MARAKHDRLERLLLGRSLRAARKARQIKAVDLGKRVGMSPGFLAEIEKGEKSPSEKNLHLLARALNMQPEVLITPLPGTWQKQLHELLTLPMLKMLPLDLFGLTTEQLVVPLENAPREFTALLDTLAEVARGYDMGVESLMHLMLRSYQESHANHFPEIEQAASTFMATEGLSPAAWRDPHKLAELAQRRFGIRTDFAALKPYSRLSEFRSVWLAGQRKLLLNELLSPSQQAFQIGRELGYQVLGLQERGLTSSRVEVESFGQVLNDFKASYFAGALLLPYKSCVADIKRWFSWKRWQPHKFLALMKKYGVTPEIFFYRLTQLIPAAFQLNTLHFMRFTEVHEPLARIVLTKHFNLSGVHIPSGINLQEHFCARWLGVSILQHPMDDEKNPPNKVSKANTANTSNAADTFMVQAQRSRFDILSPEEAVQDEFFCVSMARRLSLSPGGRASVTLGFRLTAEARRLIAFSADPALVPRQLGNTCERCPLSDAQCAERVAPPTMHLQEQQRMDVRRALEALQRQSPPAFPKETVR